MRLLRLFQCFATEHLKFSSDLKFACKLTDFSLIISWLILRFNMLKILRRLAQFSLASLRLVFLFSLMSFRRLLGMFKEVAWNVMRVLGLFEMMMGHVVCFKAPVRLF